MSGVGKSACYEGFRRGRPKCRMSRILPVMKASAESLGRRANVRRREMASAGSKMSGVENSASDEACDEGFRQESRQTSEIPGVEKSASDEGLRRESRQTSKMSGVGKSASDEGFRREFRQTSKMSGNGEICL